eukprot:TRINITY_DN6218_c0_g3_i1.p1 TRINITY_DN6218_c0_g3~~TRINITY_DN6218_c0_g3_i1.p1  ORF type:complete len:205 (-),score=8.58 TRINITY_DN6218_c0_g3_i1:539-1153(-)
MEAAESTGQIELKEITKRDSNENPLSFNVSALSGLNERKGTKNSLTFFSEQITELKSTNIKSQNVVRLYNVWQGRNNFPFQGWFITGPKYTPLILTNVFIQGVMAFYYYLVVRYLWASSKISPLLAIYLHVSLIISMLMTSFRDPGIIPRRKILRLIGKEDTLYLREDDRQPMNGAENSALRAHKAKKCVTCQINRPPRSSHCR